jgi:hypothetical protein
MALRYDLRINQGETFQLAVPVLDANGSPVSLSGMTARAQVRSYVQSAAPLYEWSTTNGNLAFDGNDVVLTVPASASSAWTFRTGQWSLELVDTNSDTTLLVEGYVIVHPEITR